MALLFLHLRSLFHIDHSGKRSPAAPQRFGGTTFFFAKQHVAKDKSTQSLLQLPLATSSVTALRIFTTTNLLLTRRCQRQDPQLTRIHSKGSFPTRNLQTFHHGVVLWIKDKRSCFQIWYCSKLIHLRVLNKQKFKVFSSWKRNKTKPTFLHILGLAWCLLFFWALLVACTTPNGLSSLQTRQKPNNQPSPHSSPPEQGRPRQHNPTASRWALQPGPAPAGSGPRSAHLRGHTHFWQENQDRGPALNTCLLTPRRAPAHLSPVVCARGVPPKQPVNSCCFASLWKRPPLFRGGGAKLYFK